MSIGTPKDLLSASFGNKVRDTTKPPARMVGVTPAATGSPAFRESQARRQALGMGVGQLGELSNLETQAGIQGGQYGNALTQARQSPLTNTFANILAGSGQRGSGKYGGFNTATDLESAVLGSTYELRDSTVPTLRAKAQPYLEQVSNMGSDAYRQAMNSVMQGVTGKIPALPMGMTEVPEGSVYATRVNPLRQYKQQLTDWESEAALPAEEYLQTAQQIESTPMSELARSIAINRYGMDPMLAAGKFASIGDDYWKKERDEEYQATYGKPYEQYEFEQNRLTDLASGGSKEKIANATAQLESLTGLRATTLSEAASQTPVQMIENMSRTYQIPDPMTGEMIEANGAGIVELIRNSVGSSNNQGLQNLYETLICSPGSEGMALLMGAIVREYVGQPQKTLGEHQDLGIFA